MLVIFIIFFK